MNRTVLITAAVLVTSLAPATSSAATTVSIVQHGGSTVHGQHLLTYPARGTLTGIVGGASTGVAVKLQQLRFPFSGTYRTVATTTTGSGGKYSFTVHPVVATRYRVVSHATASRIVIFYVTAGGKFVSATNCIGQSTCHATWISDVTLPAAVAGTETRKHFYVYDGIRPGSLPPTRLYLNTHATTTITRLTSSRYRYTTRWTMQFPTRSTWQVNGCTRDTYTKDGFGLPSFNGCGAASISNPAGYLG